MEGFLPFSDKVTFTVVSLSICQNALWMVLCRQSFLKLVVFESYDFGESDTEFPSGEIKRQN